MDHNDEDKPALEQPLDCTSPDLRDFANGVASLVGSPPQAGSSTQEPLPDLGSLPMDELIGFDEFLGAFFEEMPGQKSSLEAVDQLGFQPSLGEQAHLEQMQQIPLAAAASEEPAPVVSGTAPSANAGPYLSGDVPASNTPPIRATFAGLGSRGGVCFVVGRSAGRAPAAAEVVPLAAPAVPPNWEQLQMSVSDNSTAPPRKRKQQLTPREVAPNMSIVAVSDQPSVKRPCQQPPSLHSYSCPCCAKISLLEKRLGAVEAKNYNLMIELGKVKAAGQFCR